MNIRDGAPVPDRLMRGTKGERNSDGYLVAHVVVRTESTGNPILKLVDTAKADACMRERRCQTCGYDIAEDEWLGFIGMPEEKFFKEAPLHLDCANYAIATCPHLIKSTVDELIAIAVCKSYRYLGYAAPEDSSNYGLPLCAPDAVRSISDRAEIAARVTGVRYFHDSPRLRPAELAHWVG
jgi:hypothetical protein